MSINNNLPNYQKIFGSLDFKQGDEGRSAYSPAAYLADLLQLMEDNFQDPDFFERRPDVKEELVLNGENTFTQVPYLDIVNRVLEKRISAASQNKDAYSVLKEDKYPHSLPFELDHERAKKFLAFLQTKATDFYRLFGTEQDNFLQAKLELGLSDELARIILEDLSENEPELKKMFGLDESVSWETLLDAPTFLTTTGLTGSELRELLYTTLREEEDRNGETERGLVGELYLNAGLEGVMTLNENPDPVDGEEQEAALEWSGEALDPAWFDRVNRLLRLKIATGISLSDLELILRTCCSNTLDELALSRVAFIQHVGKKYDLPIDVAASLIGPLNSLGVKDEDLPQDAFNRTFNRHYAELEKVIVDSQATYVPDEYTGFDVFTQSGNITDSDNQAFRIRIQQALHLSEKQFTHLISTFEAHAEAQERTSIFSGQMDAHALSVLHRITLVGNALDLSVFELTDLFDLLSLDTNSRLYNHFESSYFGDSVHGSVYQLLEDSNEESLMWLFQTLIACADWMSAHGCSAELLKRITIGVDDQEEEEKSQLAFLQALWDSVKEGMLSEDLLTSSGVDTRTARLLIQTTGFYPGMLTDEGGVGLFRYSQEAAEKVAWSALRDQAKISLEDLEQIGLGERLATKIHEHLIRHGYLNMEGSVLRDVWPERAEDLTLSYDVSEFSQHVKTIFSAIYKELLDELPEGEDVEMSVFLSDLEPLGLPLEYLEELYDNLIYQGIISEAGVVMNPDQFAGPYGTAYCEVNSGLESYLSDIFDFIESQYQRFVDATISLNEEAFQALGLKPVELEDLMENLVFNGYLTDKHELIDKQGILDLSGDLDLALPFYPYRKQIRTILEEKILAVRNRFLQLSPTHFYPLAHKLRASSVMELLEGTTMADGWLTAEGKQLLQNTANLRTFSPDPSLSAEESQQIFLGLRSIMAQNEHFFLEAGDLMDIELEEEDAGELYDLLIHDGWLTAEGFVPMAVLPLLSNINTALSFHVLGFEDYQKDIFFLLRDKALRIEERIQELSDLIKGLADNQSTQTIQALAEYLEMQPAATSVVLNRMMATSHYPVEAFLDPVAGALNQDESITSVPLAHGFRSVLRRMKQVSALANHLGLREREISLFFDEQNITEQFPERFHLPEGILQVDAVLPGEEYELRLFSGGEFLVYDRLTGELLEEPRPLSELIPGLEGADQIDAAFEEDSGKKWIIAGTQYWCLEPGAEEWTSTTRNWGVLSDEFDSSEGIDAAFTDQDGITYLFSGALYMRYSTIGGAADEGYPKKISDHWKTEFEEENLPDEWNSEPDAGFQDDDGTLYLFQGTQFVRSVDPDQVHEIIDHWGHVDSRFEDLTAVDGTMDFGGLMAFFRGDQVMIYRNSLEQGMVYAEEGYPRLIESEFPGVDSVFQEGLDAGFVGWDGETYLFKGKEFTKFLGTDDAWEKSAIRDHWGQVNNTLWDTGVVDAAFFGLDGKVYVFSGSQYYRYSGTSYKRVDEGYPRRIEKDWGGLTQVDAAFVLDGKTYLFQNEGNGQGIYLRFSTSDYNSIDEDFPKPIDDNWWNLPQSLLDLNFGAPDAVFVGLDNRRYLFHGEHYVYFDHNHRWWSEPKRLVDDWDSLALSKVFAAFTGKDGRSYFFGESDSTEGVQVVRYSDSSYQQRDDKYPKPVLGTWGKVPNNIERTGKIQAALIVNSEVEEENQEGELVTNSYNYTYLFSGNQFFRYSGFEYGLVEEGYPKSIRNSLKDEPAFNNLKSDISGGIQGAWSNNGQVFLLVDGEMHAISAKQTRTHSLQEVFADVEALFQEEGATYVLRGDSWFMTDQPESRSGGGVPRNPRQFRQVPTEWRTGLSNVLETPGGQTFLFRGTECFDMSLQATYPIAEAWGKVRNHVAEEGKVSAGFAGTDGKFYLFSEDQYLVYSPEDQTPDIIPEEAEGLPQSIAEKWGGLEDVSIAFVRDGITYLMESQKEDGTFRYVSYSGESYEEPDQPQPQEADLSWWEIPQMYIEEGFDRVDGILVHEENLLLFRGNEFIQLDLDKNIWTYARPIEQLWRDFPYSHPDFEEIKAVVSGPGEEVYFFSEEQYTTFQDGQFGDVLPVQDRFGRTDNSFLQDGSIDASIVLDGVIYLFSGDQYGRYSQESLEYLDSGYPKTLRSHLRQEDWFSQFPEDFEDVLGDIEEGQSFFRGILADAGNLMIFTSNHLHVASIDLHRTYSMEHLGHIRNEIQLTGEIQAAFADPTGAYYLFSQDQYVRYSQTEFTSVDDGYPKLISTGLMEDLVIGDLPEAFHADLTAAMMIEAGELFLFQDGMYINASEDPSTILPVSDFWGEATNMFPQTVEDENVSVDAAFIAPGGELYVFKGKDFLRYSDPASEFADEGYPKAIKDQWGNLPTAFENGIEGAFRLDGRSYFQIGTTYVRFTDPSLRRVDDGFPQEFVNRWIETSDIQLSDIQVMSQIMQMAKYPTGSDHHLIDFLESSNGYNKDPFTFLSEFFEWDSDDLIWVKRMNAFLPEQPAETQETDFSLEQLIRIHAILSECERIGTYPQDLYTNLWVPLFVERNHFTSAETLYRILGINHQGADWEVLERQITDEMNELKRNALVDWSVAWTDGIDNPRDLFGLLLMDVEVSSCSKTSQVKEAAAAIQLYFHRYFVNLELIDPKGNQDEAAYQALKEQWLWMKNYRVWEANRKVFLYPENYIRPELRDSKTPAFEALENEILQGEINENSVTQVYNNYLNEYATVSSLKITGGYVYDDPDTSYGKELVLFGQTKKNPKQYYFRTAAFLNASSQSVEWEPWSKLEVEINANTVYPVYAFGRVFVFWSTVEVVSREEDSDQETTLQTEEQEGSTDIKVANVEKVDYYLRIYYSYQDLNGQWLQPQLLDTNISKNGSIYNVKLFVENSQNLNGNEHENILINANYDYIHWTIQHGWLPIPEVGSTTKAYSFTSEFVLVDAVKPAIRVEEREVLQSLFAVEEWGEIRDNFVQLNSIERSLGGPWFSIDHKSGSFLIKPQNDGLTAANDPVPLEEARENMPWLPDWNHIDAAFEAPDGTRYFVNNDEGLFQASRRTVVEEGGVEVYVNDEPAPISTRWGQIRNGILELNRVNAAWNRSGRLFLFSGDEYLEYSESFLVADPGSPGQLSAGNNGIPSLPSVDAVLDDGNGEAWFFSGNTVTHSKDPDNSELITTVWRTGSNSFTSDSTLDTPVTAAFVHGDHTYLINDTEFIRYTGSSYGSYDTDYPKPSSFFAILDELKCTNNDEDFQSFKIEAAMNRGGDIFFRLKHGETYKFSGTEVAPTSEFEERFTASLVIDGETYLINFKTFLIESLFGESVTISGTEGIDASVLGKDGSLYLFSKRNYYKVDPATFSTHANNEVLVLFIETILGTSTSFYETWGISSQNFLHGKTVSAALRKGDHYFLFAGDQYTRYTGTSFREPDEGYPKSIASNTDEFPVWEGMDAVLPDVNGETYFFFNGQFVSSGDIDAPAAINTRWGWIKNNIHARGIDSAVMDSEHLYLYSGDEMNRYSVDEHGAINPFLDAGYPKEIQLDSVSFPSVSASFTYGNDLYLIGQDSFICCPVSSPRQPRSGYPKPGKLGAVIKDILLRNNRSTSANVFWYLDTLTAEAAYVRGDVLVVQTDWNIFWLAESKIKLEISLLDGNIQNHAFGKYFSAADSDSFQQEYVTDDGYDSFTSVDGQFLVTRGSEYILFEEVPGTLDDIIWEEGIPSSIQDEWGSSSIDAAFHLEGFSYLFSNDRYTRFANLAEPSDFRNLIKISGNWANLPRHFIAGIDAAFKSDDVLLLFREGQVSQFTISGDFSPLPYEISTGKYDIIRLTTGTKSTLEQKMLSKLNGGGLDQLLTLETQELDEIPAFSYFESRPTVIRVNDQMVDLTGIPESNHLDFESANGIYYWEIFFHVPFLIAQVLNTNQRFELAKKWYEYIFDPTEKGDFWKFLPFLKVDIIALDQSVRYLMDGLTKLDQTFDDGGVKRITIAEKGLDENSNTSWIAARDQLLGIMDNLLLLEDAFQGFKFLEDITIGSGEAAMTGEAYLNTLVDQSELEGDFLNLYLHGGTSSEEAQFKTSMKDVQDQLKLIMSLSKNYDLMLNSDKQLIKYEQDPFDPHAIAGLRKIAYRKAILMNYIDNLLDWGDMLFTRYTMESIDEARMLYILAYDLLGRRPEGLGTLSLEPDTTYDNLVDKDDDYDFLLFLENNLPADGELTDLTFSGAVHDSIVDSPYFFVPENEQFLEYWDRVEDRLYKIRHCLNIHGVKQPLPLFQPPIDPMALVRAASGGGGFGAALEGMSVTVPHYRFTFMFDKADQLAQKLNQFSGDLLAALEKKDAEALSLLQAHQEKEIFELTLQIRKDQVEEAKKNKESLLKSKANAEERESTYKDWLTTEPTSFNGYEIAQMSVMGASVISHGISAVSRVIAAIGSAFPDVLVGPFIMGVKHGGGKAHDVFNSVAEVAQSAAEGLSIGGEILGIIGQHERMRDEWTLQRDLAEIDKEQIEYQIQGAQYQISAAKKEVSLVKKELEHNDSMNQFLQSKFSNQQLYTWMSGKLSGLYYQTYKMALDMARYAEKSFQFERGMPVDEVSYIRGYYWDSQKKGLLAGESLGLDLDRMEKAFVETDKRRLEITKEFSLLELDPLAFLRLKSEGVCEFHLTEAFFDYDFPGHYCRQVKTIAVSFDAGDGVFLNATLTQLNNRLVMKPDPKAVKYLLKPGEKVPQTIRTGWRAHEQIALSHHDEFEKNHGMFELRFDSEKYLPFEGTGAVSSWRLELNGLKGSFVPSDLVDVKVNLKYTALQGGEAFASKVRGMLKPYDAVRYFDMNFDFHRPWLDFLGNDETSFTVKFEKEMFPNMGSSKILGIYTQFETEGEGTLQAVLNEEYQLKHKKITDAAGLSIRNNGTEMTFTFRGDKSILRNLLMGMSYKARVS